MSSLFNVITGYSLPPEYHKFVVAPTGMRSFFEDKIKKEIEKDMQEDYGALSRQSNMMLLPREMSFQVINLAGLDLKMQDKVKAAILAIVDRIKIPANQVAYIDAQSSKALANGSEIRHQGKDLVAVSCTEVYQKQPEQHSSSLIQPGLWHILRFHILDPSKRRSFTGRKHNGRHIHSSARKKAVQECYTECSGISRRLCSRHNPSLSLL